MKKITIIFILFALVSCNTEATPPNDVVVIQLQKAYNADNFNAIHDLYSKKMQKFSSLERTTAFFKTKVKANAGHWKQSTYLNFKNQTYTYKVDFERSTATLAIKLNTNHNIDYLLLKKQ